MPAPTNPFKALLASGHKSIGMWMGMTDPYVAEIVARAGFDWVLIDAEHAPNDLASITRQLQVVDPHVAPVVRLPTNEPWMIKQVLDAGVQSLLAPMVNTAEDARKIVQAMRYPPAGIRGVGFALGRASYFNGASEYAATADAQMCLVVQIESLAACENLDEILAVDGVDAAFVGPADLAADMGFVSNPGAPEVQSLVAETLGRIKAAGKPAGIIEFPDDAIDRHFASGAQFVAVGADLVMFSAQMRGLATKWKSRVRGSDS